MWLSSHDIIWCDLVSKKASIEVPNPRQNSVEIKMIPLMYVRRAAYVYEKSITDLWQDSGISSNNSSCICGCFQQPLQHQSSGCKCKSASIWETVLLLLEDCFTLSFSALVLPQSSSNASFRKRHYPQPNPDQIKPMGDLKVPSPLEFYVVMSAVLCVVHL